MNEGKQLSEPTSLLTFIPFASSQAKYLSKCWLANMSAQFTLDSCLTTVYKPFPVLVAVYKTDEG